MTALAATERGSGAPIVLVHGVGASAWSSFTAMGAALAERNRVIAVDLPGSGESAQLAPPAGGWNLDTVADSLAETLEAHSVQHALLLGHSLGAAVVTRCALRHPRRVSQLVLVAAALDLEASAAVRIQLWRDLFAADRALLARYLLLSMTTPERLAPLSPRELDDLVEIARSLIAEGTATQLDLAAASTLRADLAQIDSPVTVVLGSQDALVSVEPWRRIATAGGITRLEVWAGAHDVLQHRRDEACALLSELAAASADATSSTTTTLTSMKGTHR